MQLLRLVPQGTWEVGETLKAAGEALVRGGQTKVSIGLFAFGLDHCLCYATAIHPNGTLHCQKTGIVDLSVIYHPHYAHNIPFNAYGHMFRFSEARLKPLTVPLRTCMIDG
jgi:hypothetical protein